MKNYVIYSLKVWLGSVLIGPVVAALLEYCISLRIEGALSFLIFLYPPVILLIVLISFLTWLVFWLVINVIIRIVPEMVPQKCWITLAGITLTLGTFYLFLQGDIFSLKNDLFPAIVGYATGITVAVWYFDPAKPVVLLEP